MVYAINMQDDEENKVPTQGAVAPAASGVQLAPADGVGDVEAAGGAPGAGGRTKGGGQFATLDKYITANQGQAQPLANKVTTGIQNEFQGLQNKSTETLGGINKQVEAAQAPADANELIAQQAANPVSFTGDQGNINRFQKLLTSSYGGPASAESTSDFTTQQNAINKAIATGKQQTTTEAGREQLLSKHERAPSTSVTGLNSAILSHSPEALGQVESAYKPFESLLAGLSSGAKDVNERIARTQQNLAGANKAANESIQGQISGLNQNVNAAIAKAQQDAAARNATLKANLASGKLTDQDLGALGMSREQWDSLSRAQKAAATSELVYADPRQQFGAQSGTVNLDLNEFLTAQDPNLVYNAQNVATPEQYQKAQSFQRLLSGLNTGAPSLAINPADATKAGTAPTNLNSFDYQTALNTAQQAKAGEMAAAKAYATALQSGADEEHAQRAAAEEAKKTMAYGLPTVANMAVGPALAGAAGMGEGMYDSAKGVVSKPTLKNTADLVNSMLGPKAAVNVVKGTTKGITSAVNTVKNIFCFHPDTLVAMDDGTDLPINRIQVGDRVKGGVVIATTRAIGTDFYWYKGVLVTAKHAVREGNRWLRVEQSELGTAIPKYVEIVHSLVTSNHRIWVGDIEFADQHENDNYENLNLDESIAELNKKS